MESSLKIPTWYGSVMRGPFQEEREDVLGIEPEMVAPNAIVPYPDIWYSWSLQFHTSETAADVSTTCLSFVNAESSSDTFLEGLISVGTPASLANGE
jgi:phosphodiesterase/alkaline phosphatase D-like protein